MSAPGAFGPFRVMHQIGVGVLGPVFRTYDPEQDRLFAVKAFHVDITPEQADTLVEILEGLVSTDLSHRGLVLPVAAGLEDGVPYLAQEYVAAESLDVAMRHYAPASISTTLPLVEQLAKAVDAAHAAGVCHGGLHLRDVFVTPEGGRLTGFGVVPALEDVGLHGPIRRPYTAPEMIAGRSWGPEADRFALAAIAYELLTGKRAAGTGSQVTARLEAIDGVADVEALQSVFASGLADAPDSRYSSAARFASDLWAAVGTDLDEADGILEDDDPVVRSPRVVAAGAGAFDLLDAIEIKDEPVEEDVVDELEAEAADTLESLEEIEEPDEPEESAEPGEFETVEVDATDAAGEMTRDLVGDEGAELDIDLPLHVTYADGAGETDLVEARAVDDVSDDDVADDEEEVEGQGEDEEGDELLELDDELDGEIEEDEESEELDESDEVDEELEAEELDEDEPGQEGDAVQVEDVVDDELVASEGEWVPEPPVAEHSSDLSDLPDLPPLPSAFESTDDDDDAEVDGDDDDDDADEDEYDAELQRSDLLDESDEFDPGLPIPVAAGQADSAAATGGAWTSSRTTLLVAVLVAGAAAAYYAGLQLGGASVGTDGAASGSSSAGLESRSVSEVVVRDVDDVTPEVGFSDEPTGRTAAGTAGRLPTPPAPDAVPEPPPVVTPAITETSPTPAPELAAPVAARATEAPASTSTSQNAGVGWLLVRTTPPGADVTLDGVGRGQAPLSLRDVPYGTYRVEVSHAGFRSQTRDVTLSAAGAVAAVGIELLPVLTGQASDPALGSVSIDSRPTGARVILDGQMLGMTPVVLSDVPAGRHQLRLERDGYQAWVTTIDVPSSDQMRVAASLDHAPR